MARASTSYRKGCACIHACAYTCTLHMHVHTYVHVYAHACAYTCAHMRVHTRARAYTCVEVGGVARRAIADAHALRHEVEVGVCMRMCVCTMYMHAWPCQVLSAE